MSLAQTLTRAALRSAPVRPGVMSYRRLLTPEVVYFLPIGHVCVLLIQACPARFAADALTPIEAHYAVLPHDFGAALFVLVRIAHSLLAFKARWLARRREPRALAVAMALHPRLGHASALRQLEPSLLPALL